MDVECIIAAECDLDVFEARARCDSVLTAAPHDTMVSILDEATIDVEKR